MTTVQSDRLNQYVAGAGQTVFNYTYPIMNQADIQVDSLAVGGLAPTTLVLNVDYTVQNVGDAAGGTITLTNPAVGGETLAIFGINEYRQANYAQSGDFLAQDVNTDIDQVVRIGQQNRRDIDKSIRAPMTDPPANYTLPPATERASKYIYFDVNGDLTVTDAIGIDTDQLVSVDGDIVVWDGTDASKVKSAENFVTVPSGTTAERPAIPVPGMIRYNTTLSQIEGYDGGQWVNLLTSGTGAPIGASYIVRQQEGVLTNETVLADLATGLLKNTTGTGNPSIAAQGVDYYAPGGTDVAVADGGTGASTAAGARTNLGLIIGTDVQRYDATLDSISNLGTAANKMAYTTGVDTWAEADITAAGRALLDDADAVAQRTTLGLGTLATQNGTFSGTSSGNNTGDQNLFSTIQVAGQSDVVAESGSDSLTLVAGTNVTITTDATTDSITIAASGGGGGGTPGGANTNVQYNNAGAFAGDAGFVYDGAGTVTLTQYINAAGGGDIAGVDIFDQAGVGTVASTSLGLAASAGDLYINATTGNVLIQNIAYPSVDGTNGQLLSTNGAGVTSWVNPGAGTGSLVKISTATAAASATISFTGLSNTYISYIVVISDMSAATSGTYLTMRTSSNNGVSYDSGATDYGYYNLSASYNGTTITNASIGTSLIALTTSSGGAGMLTTAGNTLGGTVTIFNPASTTSYKKIIHQNTYPISSGSGGGVANMGGGSRYSTTAVNAIQFALNSGNIASGTFTLYGVLP